MNSWSAVNDYEMWYMMMDVSRWCQLWLWNPCGYLSRCSSEVRLTTNKHLCLISSSRILHSPQVKLFVLNFSGLVCLSGFVNRLSVSQHVLKKPHLPLFTWPFESQNRFFMGSDDWTRVDSCYERTQAAVSSVNQTLNCIAVYLNSFGNLPYFHFIYFCSPCYGGAISRLTKPLVTGRVGNSLGYPAWIIFPPQSLEIKGLLSRFPFTSSMWTSYSIVLPKMEHLQVKFVGKTDLWMYSSERCSFRWKLRQAQRGLKRACCLSYLSFNKWQNYENMINVLEIWLIKKDELNAWILNDLLAPPLFIQNNYWCRNHHSVSYCWIKTWWFRISLK